MTVLRFPDPPDIDLVNGGRSKGLTRLSDVIPQALKPLWPGFIYFGKLTILDGPCDVGKSTLLLDIAARLTTGRKMPLGTGPALEPMNVLLMTAEDDLADTVTHRFKAAGGDPSRLWCWEDRIEKGSDGADIKNGYISLGEHLADLEAHIVEKQIRLAIVDVLMAYLGDINSYKDQEIRKLFAALTKLAAHTGCAIVPIRHPKKGRQENAKDSGGGSAGITNAARSVMRADIHPDSPEIRVLASVKLNLAVRPPSLSYRLVPCANEVGYSAAPKIEWLEAVEVTADELVAGPQKEKSEASKPIRRAELCAKFILGLFDEAGAAAETGGEFLEGAWAAKRVKEAKYNTDQMTEGKQIAGVASVTIEGVKVWILKSDPLSLIV